MMEVRANCHRESKRKEFYRINMSFTLEVQIIDFDEKLAIRVNYISKITRLTLKGLASAASSLTQYH